MHQAESAHAYNTRAQRTVYSCVNDLTDRSVKAIVQNVTTGLQRLHQTAADRLSCHTVATL